MEFTVPCECGIEQRVHEGAAGGYASCACGRTISIPSLGRLRRLAGLSEVALTPEQIVREGLRNGSLPPSACTSCGAATEERFELIAECERTVVRRSGGFDAWFVVMLLFGWISLRSDETVIDERGRDLTVDVPVALCAVCRASVPTRAGWQVPSLLKWLLVFAGLLLMALEPVAGIVTLAVVPVVNLLEWRSARRREQRWRTLVATVPAYVELLERFPEARIDLG